MDWLQHPAFHSGAAPFLVALIIIQLLQRFLAGLVGLATVLAFLLSAVAVIWSNQMLLPSIYKILSVCIAMVFLGLVLDRFNIQIYQLRSVLWTTGMVAALWVFWPELVDMPVPKAILMGIMATFYPAWMTWGLSEIHYRPIQAYVAITSLGVGTGVASVFGESAFVGQIALAMGFAATAGLFLNIVVKWPCPAGYVMIVPTGLTLGLLGISALVYAKLSPVSLVTLALIPLLLLIVPESTIQNRQGFTLFGILLLGIVLVAVYLAYLGASKGYY